MFGCFSDSGHTWLVTEFADGGELFNAISSPTLTDDKKKRYSSELFQAVAYLHKHCIGHRDISLENILIKEDAVKLMDFGLAVRSHSTSGTALRYFRPTGKAFYRAPEVYVPRSPQVKVVAPCHSEPGDVVMVRSSTGYLTEVCLPFDAKPGSTCTADICGYAVQPADMFAMGMAICILWCGFPLWKSAVLADSTFAFVHRLQDKGIATLLQRWDKPLPARVLNLVSGTLRTDAPSKRLSAVECLQSPLFTTSCLTDT
jgi:serine/threonine protein kinase